MESNYSQDDEFKGESNHPKNHDEESHQPNPPVEQKTSKVPAETSWLDKCPVCKSGQLLVDTKKKLFGLIAAESVKCNNCGAVFVKKGDKYSLTKVLDTSNAIWQDYGNQALTEKEWKNIAYGGKSDDKQKEADMELWMTRLKNGNIRINIEGNSPIILKKNEELQLTLSNVSFMEPRSIRTGGYKGTSIKVAKGLYFRVGGVQSESHEELRNIDKGSLTITNKRIVFSGSKKTINIDLKKIITVEPYSDGIALRLENKEKTQYFTWVNKPELTIGVNNRIYKEPLTGLVLMYLIEGLTKQAE